MSSLDAPSSDACLLHLQDQYCFEVLMKHTILKAALPVFTLPRPSWCCQKEVALHPRLMPCFGTANFRKAAGRPSVLKTWSCPSDGSDCQGLTAVAILHGCLLSRMLLECMCQVSCRMNCVREADNMCAFLIAHTAVEWPDTGLLQHAGMRVSSFACVHKMATAVPASCRSADHCVALPCCPWVEKSTRGETSAGASSSACWMRRSPGWA